MNEQTFIKRFDQLVTLINIHPNKDELLSLMSEQLIEDTNVVAELG